MKLTITTLLLVFVLNSFSQATNANAVQIAEKIAKKMKDSLSLTEAQKGQIYTINMDLHNQKQDARTQNAGNQSATATAIQNIEKTRDSLYQPILTTAQYNEYKLKKRNLVSNN